MIILVVEDEKKVSTLIRKGLEEEEYGVEVAADGEKGFQLAAAGRFDLIILDVMLPRKDGLSVVRDLRAAGVTTPVLMLTAKTATDDKVQGLDSGADDYLTKPFAFEELLARVRSLLRRGSMDRGGMLIVADLELDPVSRKAKRGGKSIDLTAKEFALLEYFMRNRDRVLTRAAISEKIWDYSFDTGTNIIDVYISHLRNKIDAASDRKLIHTVRGVGYVMKEG